MFTEVTELVGLAHLGIVCVNLLPSLIQFITLIMLHIAIYCFILSTGSMPESKVTKSVTDIRVGDYNDVGCSITVP